MAAMATVKEKTTRANIRIEIKNDFSEAMDCEETEAAVSNDEAEDGELSEDEEDAGIKQAKNKIAIKWNEVTNRTENHWNNVDGGFATGVDIFAKDEQEKLQTRAERFGLDPTESTSMTDQQLQELHNSLGITVEDEVATRFEAIHMYGTAEMSTQDIFEYFGKFGPASIEWINDESCNVVWLDRISAARAFHGMSSAINGMPVSGKCNPFEDLEAGEPTEESGKSILIIAQEQAQKTTSEDGENKMHEDCIHVSDITIPIPPGYWRLGTAHNKSKFILLRFAKRTDKKMLRAEKFSEYYRKYGNPNYGGMKGLISQSKKLRMKGFKAKPAQEPEETNPEVERGNPWGNLAKSWSKDVEEPDSSRMKPSKSILERLGNASKRSHSDSDPETPIKTESIEEKKSKVPRMRMYADEEEARLEKVKQLKKIRTMEQIQKLISENESQKRADLRNRLQKRATIRRASSDEEMDLRQKSKVTMVVKKYSKPAVASTIWSRLDQEKLKLERVSDSEESDGSEASSSSDDGNVVRSFVSKSITTRPGFRGDLKSRLSLKSEHKSPLRIEINNDHYKKS